MSEAECRKKGLLVVALRLPLLEMVLFLKVPFLLRLLLVLEARRHSLLVE
jgi:hypothetical protein